MNPIYASDEQQLDFIGIGMEILRVARNELYLNMRFLDVALSSLQFVPDGRSVRSARMECICIFIRMRLPSFSVPEGCGWRGLSAQPAALPLRASVEPEGAG